jgi:hypothetical protein
VSKLEVLKIFQVPVRRFLSPGTGMRPGGWETLLYSIVDLFQVTVTEEILAGVLEGDDESVDENKYSVLDLFRYKNLRAKTW